MTIAQRRRLLESLEHERDALNSRIRNLEEGLRSTAMINKFCRDIVDTGNEYSRRNHDNVIEMPEQFE